jgi:hypothetical protein
MPHVPPQSKLQATILFESLLQRAGQGAHGFIGLGLAGAWGGRGQIRAEGLGVFRQSDLLCLCAVCLIRALAAETCSQPSPSLAMTLSVKDSNGILNTPPLPVSSVEPNVFSYIRYPFGVLSPVLTS